MPPDAVATPALTVRDVSVRFGGIDALGGVNFTVNPGEVTGLIGPNGAGKTTLFNVISGLQRPNRGEVLLGAHDITRMTPHKRARLGLARTFQRLELFSSLGAGDNIRVALESFGRPDNGAPVALLERVGVDAPPGVPVSTLPTGAARLVELARALSIDPKVLLLDEPCSGLDEQETAGLGRLLQSLAGEGRAVLLVEHDTELVLQICTTVHVLDFGEIIASGTPEEVRRDPLVRAAYLGALNEPDPAPAPETEQPA